MAVPDLSWDITAFSSATDPNTIADVVSAINTNVGLASANLSIVGSASNYIRVSPASGPLTAMEILIIGDAVSSPDSTQMVTGHTTAADVIMVGIVPTGGTFNASNLFNATGPYGVAPGGTSTYWSGYMRVGTTVSGTDHSRVRLIHCLEGFGLFIEDSSAVNRLYGINVGALMVAATAAQGHLGTTERLYMMNTTGNVLMETAWANNANDWMTSGGSNGQAFQCFDPANPGTFTALERHQNVVSPERMKDDDGNVFPVDFVYYASATNNMKGKARQMKLGGESTGQYFEKLYNASSVRKAIGVAGGNDILAYDQLWYTEDP